MADANVGVKEADSPDKLIDNESLVVGSDTVYRQRTQISGTGASDIAPVDSTRGVKVDPVERVGSATVSNVSNNGSGVTVVSSNASRQGLWVYNDSGQDLYLKMGSSASSTDFSVKVDAGGFWEMPVRPIYTGEVSGIWESTATPEGDARVTEV